MIYVLLKRKRKTPYFKVKHQKIIHYDFGTMLLSNVSFVEKLIELVKEHQTTGFIYMQSYTSIKHRRMVLSDKILKINHPKRTIINNEDYITKFIFKKYQPTLKKVDLHPDLLRNELFVEDLINLTNIYTEQLTIKKED
jgi:hypothetical protein